MQLCRYYNYIDKQYFFSGGLEGMDKSRYLYAREEMLEKFEMPYFWKISHICIKCIRVHEICQVRFS
jgi:hypothetical protein